MGVVPVRLDSDTPPASAVIESDAVIAKAYPQSQRSAVAGLIRRHLGHSIVLQVYSDVFGERCAATRARKSRSTAGALIAQ